MMSHEKNHARLVVCASDNAMSDKTAYQDNQVSSMSSQWRGHISHECTPTEVTLWFAMDKKYLGKLNLWHTLGIAAQHKLVQASRTDSTSRCSHFYHDPACLTWVAIALRCTVNSLYSWYKLPSDPLWLLTILLTRSPLACFDMLCTLEPEFQPSSIT